MTTVDRTVARSRAPRLAETLRHDLLSATEVLEVRATVHQVAIRVVAPVIARIVAGDERTDGFSRNVFDALAAEALHRIPFAIAGRGDGLAYPAATAIAVEERDAPLCGHGPRRGASRSGAWLQLRTGCRRRGRGSRGHLPEQQDRRNLRGRERGSEVVHRPEHLRSRH